MALSAAAGMGIGAGMTALTSLGQMIGGGIQARRGRKDLEELEKNRPTYQRPDEVNQAGRLSRLRAMNPNLPGQDLMEQSVRGTTANTIQNIQDMGGVGDVYMAQIGENQALNQIGLQSAQQRIQNELNLMNQLQQEADYTDKEFDYNVNIPYQEKRQDALSRIGAGMQNLFGGMTTLSAAGTGFMNSQKQEGWNTTQPSADGQIDVNPVSQINSLFGNTTTAPNAPNRLSSIRSMYGYNNPIGINFPGSTGGIVPNRLSRIKEANGYPF